MMIITFIKRKLGLLDEKRAMGAEGQLAPVHESYQPSQADRELVKSWVQEINDSISILREELHRIPALTAVELKEESKEFIEKLDALPERIVGPIKEVVDLSKREILTELMRFSSHRDSHDSNDSDIMRKETVTNPIQEVSKELTGKQKRLLALLLDSGFLSYSEIGEKLGITHESAKNFVNRLLKDRSKARLLSKQDRGEGIKVGVSNEIQDEILKEKYRTKPNDSR